MYISKISAVESIKISITTIVKITYENAGIHNVLNCQTTRRNKDECKTI